MNCGSYFDSPGVAGTSAPPGLLDPLVLGAAFGGASLEAGLPAHPDCIKNRPPEMSKAQAQDVGRTIESSTFKFGSKWFAGAVRCRFPQGIFDRRLQREFHYIRLAKGLQPNRGRRTL